MTEGCLRARAGLAMSHAKLLEYSPESDRLLYAPAWVGSLAMWGQYQVAPDIDIPIGYAYAFSEPVAIADYSEATKWRYPSILKEHHCVASLNVPVRTDAGAFGILEVDNRWPRGHFM